MEGTLKNGIRERGKHMKKWEVELRRGWEVWSIHRIRAESIEVVWKKGVYTERQGVRTSISTSDSARPLIKDCRALRSFKKKKVIERGKVREWGEIGQKSVSQSVVDELLRREWTEIFLITLRTASAHMTQTAQQLRFDLHCTVALITTSCIKENSHLLPKTACSTVVISACSIIGSRSPGIILLPVPLPPEVSPTFLVPLIDMTRLEKI